MRVTTVCFTAQRSENASQLEVTDEHGPREISGSDCVEMIDQFGAADDSVGQALLFVFVNHVGPEDVFADADGFDQNHQHRQGEHPPCRAGLSSPFYHRF